jgi:ketosteroid isomerase-like protein
MRISWIDDDGKQITFAGLANEFTLHIKADLGTDNDCSATVFSNSVGISDKYLTFKDNNSGFSAADISFNKAMTTTLRKSDGSKAPDTCKVRFALYVWEKNNAEWKTLTEMSNILKAEVTGHNFASTMSFDAETANFRATFSKEDIIAVLDRFTEDGLQAIKFKAVAFVIGHLPTTLDAYESKEFKIIITDFNQAETCKYNRLTLGAVRPSITSYTIP